MTTSVLAKGSSTTRRAAALAFGVICAVIGLSPVCAACTCAEQASEQELSEGADFAFIGWAMSVDTSPDGERMWHFDVQSVQQGDPAPKATVVTGPVSDTCAPAFTIGDRYQIYAQDERGRLVTNMCSGNHNVGRGVPPYAGEEAPTVAGRGDGPVYVPGAREESGDAGAHGDDPDDPDGGDPDDPDAAAGDTDADATAPTGDGGRRTGTTDGRTAAAEASADRADRADRAHRANRLPTFAVMAGVAALVAIPVALALRRRRRAP